LLSPDPDAPIACAVSPRRRHLLLLVVALLIAGQGSAMARHKKKHRSAPAHRKAPAESATGSDSGETETDDEKPAATAPREKEPEPARSEHGDATPSADAPAPDEEQQPPPRRPATTRASQVDAKAGGRGLPPALEAGIRLGAVYRRLSWSQVSSGTLVPYSVSPAPEVGVRVEFYPAALVGRDFGANLGALLAFDRGFGGSVQGPTGEVSAIFQDFLLGLKIRFPFGFFIPHASVSYGGQVFKFSAGLPSVPNVFYAFVRIAAGARLQLTEALDLDVAAAYLPVIDAGKQAGYVQSTDYFPAMSSQAFEASGSVGVRVSRLFGVRGGVEFRQYALQTSNAGGMFAAQGGTDRFLTPWLMVEIVLDGAGPEGHGPED
jgi:hypothetical protein